MNELDLDDFDVLQVDEMEEESEEELEMDEQEQEQEQRQQNLQNQQNLQSQQNLHIQQSLQNLQNQQLQASNSQGDNQSIQSIAHQAAAAMAAAMAAQQLLASAAAICGIDLASLSNFAVLAGQSSGAPSGLINGQPQSPEQLMAAAVAAAAFLSPNHHLVPEDLTVGQQSATSGGSAGSTPAPLLTPSHSLYQHTGSASSSPISGPQLLKSARRDTFFANSNGQPQRNSADRYFAGSDGQQQRRDAYFAGANGPTQSLAGGATPSAADLLALELANQFSQQQQRSQQPNQPPAQQLQQIQQIQQQQQQQQQQQHQQTNNHHHRHHHLLGGHHHHSSIQTQQQLLATKGFNPMAVVVGSGQQTEILTPTHLRKAKLMFFYVRYPNSSTLKECFRDVRFNKNNTAQLVKWFSNFREFYYIQMEKFARDAVADDRIQCKDDIVVNHDHELINQLNNHYNKNRHIELPEVFRQVVEETLRHFFDAIHQKRDQEQSWKKAIYKLIARLDQEVPEVFKSDAFNEHLE